MIGFGQVSLSGARRDTVIGISSVTNKQIGWFLADSLAYQAELENLNNIAV